MKQKKFWSKLLSLGLAAAMTIASLTGPGSVTNPVEVKAASETQEIKSVTLEFEDVTDFKDGMEVGKADGTKEFKPTSIIVTISATSGAAVKVAATSPGSIKIAPNAEGKYEHDGITVSFSGSVTKDKVDFKTAETITVTVTGNDNAYSGTVSVKYVIGSADSSGEDKPSPEKPATPTFDPVSETSFDSTLSVKIATTTADATIYYTLDGKDPTAESAKYEKPVEIKATTTVKAIAIKGDQKSDIATATYTKKSSGSDNSGSGSGSGSGSNSGGSSTSTPSTTPSTGNTTTTTETKPDGTKVETTTETKADGTKVETVTETKKDGSATTTVKETEKNASGKEVAVTTVTEKDASGKVQSETKTSVIAKADTNTSATVTAVKDSKGAVTATAEVKKTGTTDETGKTNGAISAAVVKQITEAAGTSDVTITQTVTNGSKKFTVEVNAKNLVSGSNLKIMKLDPKTGEYVLCNKKNYAVNAAGDVNLSIKTDGSFILVNAADAKAASDAILKTVTLKSSSKTVTKGKSTTVAMSNGLNMKNVSKITYTVSNKSVATVSKSGKVTTKKAGTVTVKAKVTLKNGKTKTVTMKIKVK